MADIKYHYALESNKLVPIEEVNRNERQLHSYTCLGCGAEMTPKMGPKNAWHFAHKSYEENCCSETYLHMLAKRLIKERFESKRPFTIKFKRIRLSKCTEFNSCPFHDDCKCQRIKESENLKELYDYCQEEAPINGFKADLLLTSSKTDREPVLIEIQVTHPCTEEKLNSGLKIIEIKVNCEEDIKNILKGDSIRESHNGYLSLKQPVKSHIRLHNFDNCFEHLGERSISRFILYSNGILKQFNNQSCHTLKQKLDPKSIFEVSILVNGTDRYPSETTGYVIALHNYPDFKSCNLCKNKCDSFSKDNKTRHSKAKNAIDCKSFVIDQQMVSQIDKKLPQYYINAKKNYKFTQQLDLHFGSLFD